MVLLVSDPLAITIHKHYVIKLRVHYGILYLTQGKRDTFPRAQSAESK